MNNVILIGRLTKDPELKYTTSGDAVVNFTLAVQRNFKNKQGEYDADFIMCQTWGKRAENIANYLRKGSKAGINGRLQIRSYKAQDGSNRWAAEVIANEVEFLDSKSSGGGMESNGGLADGFTAIDDNDIPF